MGTGDLGGWVLGTVALVVVIILGASVSHHRRERLLARTGERAVGRVTASGCDTNDMGDRTYWVKVQYDHEDHTLESRVVVRRLDQERYQVGQRIGLTYAPSRPQLVKLDPPA